MSHFHPCNFHCHRFTDRGWGEAAFEYRWDSTSGIKAEDGLGNPDLQHCSLYELTTYEENEGHYCEGFLHPPDPPFADWKFRDPTDGRSGSVGHEAFPPRRAGHGIGINSEADWSFQRKAKRFALRPLNNIASTVTFAESMQ